MRAHKVRPGRGTARRPRGGRRAEGLRWPAFGRSSRRAAAAPEVTALHPQPGPSRGCPILGPSDAPSGPENSPSAHANRKAATRAAFSSGRPFATTAARSSPSTQARWSRFRARQDHRSVQVRRPRPGRHRRHRDGGRSALGQGRCQRRQPSGRVARPGSAIVNRHDLVFAGTPSESEIAAAHVALPAAGHPLAAFILSSFGTRPRPQSSKSGAVLEGDPFRHARLQHGSDRRDSTR